MRVLAFIELLVVLILVVATAAILGSALVDRIFPAPLEVQADKMSTTINVYRSLGLDSAQGAQ